ncbi:MAG: Rid family detoxifying hydrolase [Kiritimatiellia bacterium]
MPKTIIATPAAPPAIGPYSQAVKIGAFLFCAGQLGLVPGEGTLAPGGIEAETRQALANVDAVLKAGGMTRDEVVKTTVFLADLNDFPVMNAIYSEFFKDHFPARSTVQVGLPKGARVEIDMTACHG